MVQIKKRTLSVMTFCQQCFLVLAIGLPLASSGVEAQGAGNLPEGQEIIFADGFEGGTYFNWMRASFGSSDIDPPDLVIIQPHRVLYNEPSPPIEISFEDIGDGIAPGSFRLYLDGVDLTTDCTVSGSSATCPNPTLSPGPHPLLVSIWDLGGNRTMVTLEVYLVVDTTVPELAITEPVFEVLFRPVIIPSATYLDFESGIDRGSVRVELDGIDLTPDCAIGWTSASCEEQTLTTGPHEIRVEVRDAAGNESIEVQSFDLAADATPPSLTFTAPDERVFVNDPPRYLRFQYFDTESGVDRNSITVQLNGVDISEQCTRGETRGLCRLEDLADGSHQADVWVKDSQGNQAHGVRTFEKATNTGPPTVTILAPAENAVLTESPVELRVRILDDNAVTRVEINGEPVEFSGGDLVVSLDATDGFDQQQIWAWDEFGQGATAYVHFRVDLDPPRFNLREPEDGAVVNEPQVRVRGTVTDVSDPIEVTVNGSSVPVDGVWFDTMVTLVSGENNIHVQAVDTVGHAIEATRTVTLIQPPKVSITSPAPDELVLEDTITVTGVVSDISAAVTVNGLAATVIAGSFEVAGIAVQPGATSLSAKAILPNGLTSTTSVTVLRDVLPPRVTIYTPEAWSTTAGTTVLVAGLVNDLVPGTVTADDVTVTVNGLLAEVVNRSFLRRDVPLTPGDNLIEVEAIDVSGNIGRHQLFLRQDDSPAARIVVVSGNGQTGTVRQPLAQILTVQVTGADGTLAAGRHVRFQVLGNDGSFPNGLRRVSRVTDASGQASIPFTLGSRAGAGLVVVAASSPAIATPATFVASVAAGPPALLIADSGSGQVGITEQPLAAPFVATVTDADFNRLAGVAVRFVVVEGSGHFVDGSTDLSGQTDASGRAVVELIAGSRSGRGNNIVEASLVDFSEIPPIGFFASGFAAGMPAQTKIVGVVYDNTDEAVPGVTVNIEGTALSVQTSQTGYFEISNAPSGLLMLHVEGATTTRPGIWPTLEFELVSVPGRVNSLPGPIYLLPIDEARGIAVNEAEGGTLTLSEIPGLALDIEPGSVTFPNGGRSGVVSLTAVHSDKVPMPPSFGQQPRLVVTIQPAGAVFDPPARLSLPNTDSLPPGSVTELYSFDHDLRRFVSIGPGTVTEDGTAVVSDTGVGIVKAGWHCGGNPAPPGTPHDCPECKQCSGTRCIPQQFCPIEFPDGAFGDDSALGFQCPCGDDSESCRAEFCDGGGECVEDEGGPVREVLDVRVRVGGMERYEAEFDPSEDLIFQVRTTARNCIPEVKVQFGDGIGRRANRVSPGLYEVSHGYINEGIYTVKAAATCPECPDLSRKDGDMTVDLYEVAIKLDAGETTISKDGKYSEDTMIIVTAVRERDGSRINSFNGAVQIEELSVPKIYDQNQEFGAEFPAVIPILNGIGEKPAKSLAEVREGLPPEEATVEVMNYPPYYDEPLAILQWVNQGNLDPGRSRSSRYNFDWFEARVRDLYDQARGDLRIVSMPATAYEQTDIFTGRSPRNGETVLSSGGFSLVRTNPLVTYFRVEKRGQSSVCGISNRDGLVGSMYHEWRHAYQWNLVHQDIGTDDGGFGHSNSDDGDQLLDDVPVAPSNYLIDSENERPACDIDSNPSVLRNQVHQGDKVPDTYESPDWVRYVLEIDAYDFSSRHVGGQELSPRSSNE